MTRTKQVLRSAASEFRSKKPGAVGPEQLMQARPIALYGHAAWQVFPQDGPADPLGTCSVGEPSGRAVPRVAPPKPNSIRTARRTRERRRERPLSAWQDNVPAGQLKTDFTFLIGVANAVAFEAVVFVGLWLTLYGLPNLTAVSPL